MDEKPVKYTEYDEKWISLAWGNKRNEELLENKTIIARPRIKRALELCELSPGMRVLDIACGRGEVPAIACQKGCDSFGVDYSEASINFAKKVKSVHEPNFAGEMYLTRADATNLPFADNTFDRICMLDIIEHLYEPQLVKMLSEVRRILRNEGYAVIHTLPNRWVYDVTYPIIHKVVSKIPKDPRSEHEKKIHINEQDLLKLCKVIEKVNLKHSIWLEQLIPAQARWNAGEDNYEDGRDKVYPILSGFAGRILEVLSMTPMKLFLCNDIFGVLWKGKIAPKASKKFRLTETIIIRLFKKNR